MVSVGFTKKILSASIMFIIVLQTGFTRALKNGKSARYQREPLFDGVLPSNSSYYCNSFDSLYILDCSFKCILNDPICLGYLYSSNLMQCRLLRIFLGENDTAEKDNGNAREYRSIEVYNLALGKTVSSSSPPPWATCLTCILQASVDGRTNTSSLYDLFQTNFEPYPWLTINLGGLAIIRNAVLYNRNDDHGRWLHNVEIRVGDSFTWSEMEFCGLFVGPSQTGKVHTIGCRAPLYGTYVTAKIVELNYILDDPNASGGINNLVLEEIVVNGLFV